MFRGFSISGKRRSTSGLGGGRLLDGLSLAAGGRVSCLVEWGVGVLWRETAAADAMIGMFLCALLYAFGLVVVAKDISDVVV